jgi:hypothetical protein
VKATERDKEEESTVKRTDRHLSSQPVPLDLRYSAFALDTIYSGCGKGLEEH